MGEDSVSGGFGAVDMRAADFDRLYQGGPLTDGVRFRTVPWDIGQAQPFVVELEAAGRFRGDVLDVGCGLGENAIYLATRGYSVVGVDAAPTAIGHATRRARERGVDVEFVVADALRLAGYEGRFDSVLDSACYHCFDEDARHDYVAALYRAGKPGALLNLCCFTDAPGPLPAAMSVSEQSLRTTVGGAGWTITDLRKVAYLASADLADFAAEVGTDMDLRPDDTGHVSMSLWALQARRT